VCERSHRLRGATLPRRARIQTPTHAASIPDLLKRTARLLADARSVARLGASRADSAKILLLCLAMPAKHRIAALHGRAVRVRIGYRGLTRTFAVSDASELLTLKELLLEDEYGLDGLGDPRVVLDLGANIGVATFLFRSHYPNAHIVAVEPDPATFRKLVRNVGADPNVTTINSAIAAEPGSVSFHTEPMSWASRLAGPGEAGARTVSAVTLDELAERFGAGAGDLIKIDIEGAEHAVLPQARCVSRVSLLIGEVHPIAPDAQERLFAELEGRGLRHLRPLRRRSFAMSSEEPVA
jgi:FkbM family methyltransferase